MMKSMEIRKGVSGCNESFVRKEIFVVMKSARP